MKFRLWVSILGMGLLGASSVSAQTYVSGVVFGIWSAVGNPYVVEDDLIVPADKTLRINEGVQLYFVANDSLSVYGRLTVAGTLANPVTFECHSLNQNQWKGIYFKAGAMDDGEIAYANITGSFVGVSVSYCNAGVNHTSIVAKARGFDLMYANGYFTDNNIHCQFLSATGIYMVKSDAKLLRNNIMVVSTNIAFPSYGINANYCQDAAIDYSQIYIQGEGDLYGIRFENSDNIRMIFNVIESISQYVSSGIYAIDSYHPMIRNNTVATASSGIDKAILCVNSHPTITNNILVGSGDGSSVGIYCDDANPIVSFNDLWNQGVNYQGCPPGDHDIWLDPLFVGGSPFDYHLTSESPCIDAGNPVYFDPDGTRSDMGAYYYPQVSVPEPSNPSLPTEHRLFAGYPNPFNSDTMIPFAVSQRTHVTIDVVNVLGQTVARLLNAEMDAGEYRLPWSAQALPSGTYFCRMSAGNSVLHQRLILLR